MPRLRKSSEDETSLTFSMPPDVLAEASRRLGWLGLVYATAYTFAHFGPRVVIGLSGGPSPTTLAQHLFAWAAIAMGAGVFLLSRGSRVAPERLLHLGLVFYVAGAFGIAINEFWRGFYDGPRPFTGIPWEAAWILLFPAVAPYPPRMILLSSLAAASAGPVVILAAGRVSGTSFTGPAVEFVAYFLFSTYLCAVVAWVIARVVGRYGARLKQARDIGSYELVHKLGEGGMGEVWVAKHRLLARPAVIKRIRADLLGPDQTARDALVGLFEREARNTAALGSPHTINIHDFGVAEDGSFYYVMELLDGETLDAHVRRFGPVEPPRAVYLLRQVCHSIGEAHTRGLIHRDIKPANILVCRQGPDDDFIKVLDFGLVKHVAARSADTAATMPPVPAGTPAYMPPELAMAGHPVDSRADIYAIGCVAFWLLTGRHVFERESAMATMLAHVRTEPDPPSLRSPHAIPPALDAAILACLAKDLGSRPATAEELSDRLAASLNGEAWSAPQARLWWAARGGPPTASVAVDRSEALETLVPGRVSLSRSVRR